MSIAAEHKGKLELGVIYDPMRDELFTAERGQGAALNGRTIRVSQIDDLNRAMLCTGFPYDVRERSEFARHFSNFIMNAQAVRRDGTAALIWDVPAAVRRVWEEGLLGTSRTMDIEKQAQVSVTTRAFGSIDRPSWPATAWSTKP